MIGINPLRQSLSFICPNAINISSARGIDLVLSMSTLQLLRSITEMEIVELMMMRTNDNNDDKMMMMVMVLSIGVSRTAAVTLS